MCDRCDTAVTVLSIICAFSITVMIVICIATALLCIRQITIQQRKEERQISIKFKKRIFNKDRQIDELEANLLGDQDEQSNAIIEFETEGQIVTDASKTSAQVKETNLLGDQDEQSNALPESERQVIIASCSKTSALDLSQRQTEIYTEEIKKISVQLQQEISGRQNDKMQLQQELARCKKERDLFKKEFQFEQLQKNACQNKLESLIKENSHACIML